MNELQEKIDLFGSVNVRVFSQYDPDNQIDCVNVDNVDEAMDIHDSYPNDYVYFESPW